MTPASGWNARTALASIQPEAWKGRAWRMHFRTYGATDHGGSLRISGRYHRASDHFPPDQVWPALYLALGPEVALGEVLRQLVPELLPRINDYRLSELEIELGSVLDCRDPVLGLAPGDLVREQNVVVTQEMGAAAIARGAEGILVPSATGLGDNLVIFPGQLQDNSRLEVLGSRDPKLYVPR